MKTEAKQSQNVHLTIVPHSDAYILASLDTQSHDILLVYTSIESLQSLERLTIKGTGSP